MCDYCLGNGYMSDGSYCPVCNGTAEGEDDDEEGDTMKAIIIGRHQLSGDEELEVVSQENINFPAQSGRCQDILLDLFDKAREMDAVIIFQMMPGQLAVALHGLLGNDDDPKLGVIVNKPGERPTGVVRSFDFKNRDLDFSDEARAAIKFANPRAKFLESEPGYITVEMDPPLRFEFSHIEFFN